MSEKVWSFLSVLQFSVSQPVCCDIVVCHMIVLAVFLLYLGVSKKCVIKTVKGLETLHNIFDWFDFLGVKHLN